ncbi:MAG: tRNA pseudouridine(55) synthase TruB [Candidatus Sumerlaeota bacterium]|nr:tRNA pseudouridine(55) synthase TruB [Candidatus Sumerlaeota bacterium]
MSEPGAMTTSNPPTRALTGGLLIDKDSGMTSHDVVARLRRLTGQKTIGHTGTLDPLATGLMICVLGQATRMTDYLVHLEKGYECEALLGVETDSLDADGNITAQAPPEAIPQDRSAVESVLPEFIGEIEQTPPLYSAIRVRGRRLYHYARAGDEKDVEIPVRRVKVQRLELTRFEPPRIAFFCQISSGAYVRSLCRDIGRRLGCGAHVVSLRRLFIGPHRVSDALRLEEFERRPADQRRDWAASRILSIPRVAPHLPRLCIRPEARRRLLHGMVCAPEDFTPVPDASWTGRAVLACDESYEAIAIVEVTAAAPFESSEQAQKTPLSPPLREFAVRPKKVFANEV